MGAIGRGLCPWSRRWLSRCSVFSVALLLMALCILLLIVNVYELRLMQIDHVALHNVPLAGDGHPSNPIVWIQGRKLESGYMKHVFNVFERIGFKSGNAESNWDVLWSHDYPFKTLNAVLGNLRPHQKVNHFPGTGCLTNKVQLVMSEFKFIPKAFQMPEQKLNFLKYVKVNPGKLWVQKNNNHRGIKILDVEELDLDASNSFVQEYIADPFLIDQRRFDIGLYVTLTSVDPLRVYIYQGDWLIRFCAKDYYPFDHDDLEKYVIGDDYTPLWEIPSLAKYYTDLASTRKAALLSYLQKIGKNPAILSENLESAIRDMFYSKEANMSQHSTHYAFRNFFEMVRFDFLVDEDLNVYLMEVNMSPNLSSEHFAANKLLYEQVVFSVLNLVGVASSIHMEKQFSRQEDVWEMQVSSRDLHTRVENCTTDACSHCRLPVCHLCSKCMSKEQESILTSAYLEHLNRMTWRRVIPKPFETQSSAKDWNPDTDVRFQQLTVANQILFRWFQRKCVDDATWCS